MSRDQWTVYLAFRLALSDWPDLRIRTFVIDGTDRPFSFPGVRVQMWMWLGGVKKALMIHVPADVAGDLWAVRMLAERAERAASRALSRHEGTYE